MSQERAGGCQCGAIRYRLSGEAIALSVCHCTECQRQSGSAFGMSLIMPKDACHIVGTLKTFTRSSESGRPVTCAFCPECGTRIYHEPRYLDGVLNFKPGTLDDTSALRPSLEVWTTRKQAWIELPADLRSYEGQP